MTLTTLADLYRADADIMVQCGKCGKLVHLQLHQLAGRQWLSSAMPEDYEALSINECIVRLKCRKNKNHEPCGGRVASWRPYVRAHGGMATG